MAKQKIYTYAKQSISWSDIWQVVKVLRSPWLTQGPRVREFEEQLCEYTGATYAVAVSNGTAALHLATLAAGITQGDEGITSPITFLASANCIAYAGGTVKFADVEPETANIDPAEIAKQITDKTKILIPVHFAGQPCDMQKIHALAKKHNLKIIEDAAHAVGSEYKGTKIGSCDYSDATIFSFHPVKTIATGEGGAITTNDENMYKALLRLRTVGATKDHDMLTKNDGPWYYEMHELGFNYRMTELQGALGVSQFKRLDYFVKRRREIVDLYQELFKGDERFELLQEKEFAKSAYHLCPLLINLDKVSMNKREIFDALWKRGLRLQIHYIPVHTQPYYQKLGFKYGDFPNAEKYYKRTISLPLYVKLSDGDVRNIAEIVKDVVR